MVVITGTVPTAPNIHNLCILSTQSIYVPRIIFRISNFYFPMNY